MRLKRILPAPSRFGRWLPATIILGLSAPAAIAAAITLAGYYPVGSWLPARPLWSELGLILGFNAVAVIAVLIGVLYSLLAWNWRPIVLAALFCLCLLLGSPGMLIREPMQRFAFDQLERRTAVLIEAIKNYANANGVPPAALADLVPDYLPSIPTTGMVLGPVYKYGRGAGPCVSSRDWHLQVFVQEFLIVHHLFYCSPGERWVREQVD
jgi:hypothetical protein